MGVTGGANLSLVAHSVHWPVGLFGRQSGECPRRADRYLLYSLVVRVLFAQFNHRGRSVSTGWLRWRWHAQDAHLAWLIT